MKEISVKALSLNPFTAFGDDWMALSAGTEEIGFNAMTVAWGNFGTLWERGSHANRLPTAVCYVRPSRYTKAFLDREPYFALSHFGGGFNQALGYLGSHSGRNGDKTVRAGLTPVYAHGTVFFEEASTVYICRKLYHAPLTAAGFADTALIPFNYPKQDFHEMYVGEILRVLVQDEKKGT